MLPAERFRKMWLLLLSHLMGNEAFVLFGPKYSVVFPLTFPVDDTFLKTAQPFHTVSSCILNLHHRYSWSFFKNHKTIETLRLLTFCRAPNRPNFHCILIKITAGKKYINWFIAQTKKIDSHFANHVDYDLKKLMTFYCPQRISEETTYIDNIYNFLWKRIKEKGYFSPENFVFKKTQQSLYLHKYVHLHEYSRRCKIAVANGLTLAQIFQNQYLTKKYASYNYLAVFFLVQLQQLCLTLRRCLLLLKSIDLFVWLSYLDNLGPYSIFFLYNLHFQSSSCTEKEY